MTTSHLNLKWTVADTDKVIKMARSGFTLDAICRVLLNTRLESPPEEIERICNEVGIIPLRRRTKLK